MASALSRYGGVGRAEKIRIAMNTLHCRSQRDGSSHSGRVTSDLLIRSDECCIADEAWHMWERLLRNGQVFCVGAMDFRKVPLGE
jgi:hypothetical protein